MSRNRTVYVSACYCGSKKNNSSSTSNVSIDLRVRSGYVPEHVGQSSSIARQGIVTEIKNPITEECFLLSSCSLMSDDGEISSSSLDFVSKMISDMDIPFSLNNVQWRGSPVESWVSLENQDDVVRQILNLVISKTKEVKADQTKQLAFMVVINKQIVIPQDDFLSMAHERKIRDLRQEVVEGISYINQLQIPDRTFYFRGINSVMYGPYRSLIDQAMIESIKSKQIPANKSAIDALEEVVFDCQDDEASSCQICLVKMEIGSRITVMPCSHKFHKTCIISWLKTSHVCPICRFKLPTI